MNEKNARYSNRNLKKLQAPILKPSNEKTMHKTIYAHILTTS